MATETIPLRPKVDSGDAAEAAHELGALVDMFVTASTGDFHMLRDGTLNAYAVLMDNRAETVRRFFDPKG